MTARVAARGIPSGDQRFVSEHELIRRLYRLLRKVDRDAARAFYPCGHDRSAENSRSNGVGDHCKTCYRARKREKHTVSVLPNIKALATAALAPLVQTKCTIAKCRAFVRFEVREGGYVTICPECERRIERLEALEKMVGATGKKISVGLSQITRGTVVMRTCADCDKQYRDIERGGRARLYCDPCRKARHHRAAKQSYARLTDARPLGSITQSECRRCHQTFLHPVAKGKHRYCIACRSLHRREYALAYKLRRRAERSSAEALYALEGAA